MQIGISLVFEKSPEFRKKCVNTYSNLRLGDTTGRGQHTADRMTSYFRKTESSERATRDANNVVLSSGRATGTFLVYWEAYRLSRDASALRQFWVLLPLTLGLDSNCSAKRNAQRFQIAPPMLVSNALEARRATERFQARGSIRSTFSASCNTDYTWVQFGN